MQLTQVQKQNTKCNVYTNIDEKKHKQCYRGKEMETKGKKRNIIWRFTSVNFFSHLSVKYNNKPP